MKTIKIFGKEVCSCVIIRIALSTLAIITLVSLSSCVVPSSVRGNKDIEISERLDESESRKDKRKKVDEEISRDDEFAELIKEANQQNNTTKTEEKVEEIKNQDFANLLMPLNKQVEVLTNNQTDIKNKLSNIKSDVSVMKSDINEIKETLKLMTNKTVKNEIASAGIVEDESPKKNGQFTMKSDQEVEKTKEPLFVVKADAKTKTAAKKLEEKYESNEKDLSSSKVDKESNSDKQISDLNKVSFELTQSYLDNKDYSKAIAKLKEIESGITTIVEKNKHNYLLGESHYGMQQYAKAIEYFIKVLESPEFTAKEDAKLMIAESQIRNGETNSAKQTFKQLIADYPESKFVPRARKMLQKL
jgi:TolA-binding protein